MNEQFTRQAQDMFNAAKDAKIPENLQTMAEDTVSKTRDAFKQLNVASQDNVKAMEDVMLAAQAGAKAIGEKMVQNTAVNTEAAFDAAEAIARADTIPEAARLQANFMQQQMAIASAQTKELFELSTKVAQQTFETMNSVTAKSFEQFKNK
ncbi:MAG: phasin family protein [Pseudomonadota bacterium]